MLSGIVLESAEREGAPEKVVPEGEPAPAASHESADGDPEATVPVMPVVVVPVVVVPVVVMPVVTKAPEPAFNAAPELHPVDVADAASDCCPAACRPLAEIMASVASALPPPAPEVETALASVELPSELPEYGVPPHAYSAIAPADEQTFRMRKPRRRGISLRTARPAARHVPSHFPR
ncbi:MAG TPA: hypothetical protein VGY54_14650 [Polyangiaceae bacterium]|nr:hypothetical protein [Polyangiaceae bacterium]